MKVMAFKVRRSSVTFYMISSFENNFFGKKLKDYRSIREFKNIEITCDYYRIKSGFRHKWRF